MAAPRFEIHASAQVLADFRVELSRASPTMTWQRLKPALDRMHEVLSLVPLDFGEDRSTLPDMQLQQRIAFFAPLVVRYAVHESLRALWIQSIRLYGPT